MCEPAFWWRGAGPQAQLLAPLGLIYGAIAARRMAKTGAQPGLPVLCVGNFTLGDSSASRTGPLAGQLTMWTDAGSSHTATAIASSAASNNS